MAACKACCHERSHNSLYNISHLGSHNPQIENIEINMAANLAWLLQ